MRIALVFVRWWLLWQIYQEQPHRSTKFVMSLAFSLGMCMLNDANV